jgi:hypothetical protein
MEKGVLIPSDRLSKSWWATLPGVLMLGGTAIAAIATLLIHYGRSAQGARLELLARARHEVCAQVTLARQF